MTNEKLPAMNIAQRILHVGGRNNAAGYVEFGSIQAVEALVKQVLHDLPAPQPSPAAQGDAQDAANKGRCQHCLYRHDGVYGSWAAPCPYHDDDGNLRIDTARAAQESK